MNKKTIKYNKTHVLRAKIHVLSVFKSFKDETPLAFSILGDEVFGGDAEPLLALIDYDILGFGLEQDEASHFPAVAAAAPVATVASVASASASPTREMGTQASARPSPFFVRASRFWIRSRSGVSLWDSPMFGRVLEFSSRQLSFFVLHYHMKP